MRSKALPNTPWFTWLTVCSLGEIVWLRGGVWIELWGGILDEQFAVVWGADDRWLGANQSSIVKIPALYPNFEGGLV